MAKDAAPTVIGSVVDCVTDGVLESLTVNLTGVALTVALGVPDIRPVEASDSPAGSEPLLIVQL